jgi:transcriptional regulator with XRE-family HTH domain
MPNPLDTLMRRHGLNATEVAKLVGCTPETVRRWRCGIREIPPRRLDALKLALSRDRS